MVAAGVVAALATHTDDGIRATDSLWLIGRNLGDEDLVRGIALVLLATGVVVMSAGRRGWVSGTLSLAGGLWFIAIVVQWLQSIDRFPWDNINGHGYVGYRASRSLYMLVAAAALAIAGGVVTWLSPRTVPANANEYPGRAVV